MRIIITIKAIGSEASQGEVGGTAAGGRPINRSIGRPERRGRSVEARPQAVCITTAFVVFPRSFPASLTQRARPARREAFLLSFSREVVGWSLSIYAGSAKTNGVKEKHSEQGHVFFPHSSLLLLSP